MHSPRFGTKRLAIFVNDREIGAAASTKTEADEWVASLGGEVRIVDFDEGKIPVGMIVMVSKDPPASIEDIRNSNVITQLKRMSYADGATVVAGDLHLLDPTDEETAEVERGLLRLFRDEREDYRNVPPFTVAVNGRMVKGYRTTPCHVALSVDGEEVCCYATDGNGFSDYDEPRESEA